jgi:hypothetical protein
VRKPPVIAFRLGWEGTRSSENHGLHTIEIAYRNGHVELFVEVLADEDSAIWRAVAPVDAITG